MKKIFRAMLCAAALALSIPATSCSSFFGSGDEVVITSFTTSTGANLGAIRGSYRGTIHRCLIGYQNSRLYIVFSYRHTG